MDLLQVFIAATGILGQMLVGRRDARGFKVWIASNLALVTVSVSKELYLMAALYVFYSGMCVHSIWAWRRAEGGAAGEDQATRLTPPAAAGAPAAPISHSP